MLFTTLFVVPSKKQETVSTLINATIVYLGMRGDKFRVFHDGIEESIVNDLLKVGVLESELVIERYPPCARQFTPYAVS